jgi:hypothetical protein
MEEEARVILEGAIATPPSGISRGNMAERIRNRFAPLGGVELDIPRRGVSMRRIPDFSGPEFGPADDE